jgi:DNA polymerase-1
MTDPSSKQAEKMRHLYLVDGSGFIFRAFHALPPLTRSDGTPINAVFGFTQMLIKILEKADVDYFGVVFDSARRNFRHDIYPSYKANRPEPPAELIPQFPLMRDVCAAFDVPVVEMEGYEADDLIASYAKAALKQDVKVTIVSSDKDLMQLINDYVDMFDPLKERIIRKEQVIEKFGVPPEKVIDVQALAGDSSDNVPGIPGIGVKTAAELINIYGSVENLLRSAHEISQPKRRQSILEHQNEALISKKLVSLVDEIPLKNSLEFFQKNPLNPNKILGFLKEQGFRTLISRLEKQGLFSGQVPLETPSLTPFEKPAPSSIKYELVQTIDALKKWITLAQDHGIIAIDTETTSLNPLEAKLVGISLAVSPSKACYIPLGHSDSQDQLSLGDFSPSKKMQQIDLNEALMLLKPVFNDPSILKVGHNLKYDMLVLSNYGITVAPIDDTMVLSYVLDGTRNGHGLDELAGLHLAHKTITFKEVAGSGKNQITFDKVDLERACQYAAEDADVTYQLFQQFIPRLVPEKCIEVYETIDRPLVSILKKMEETGIKIDISYLKDLSHDFSKKLENLESQIYETAGHSFNIGSPKQLGEVLFEKMKLPWEKKSKLGAYVTDAETLEDLAVQGFDLPQKILDWRQLAKLKSTYSDALVKQINPKTQRVHTSYSMTTTSTGRLASSNPNLQNIPIRTEEGRKIRGAFIAQEGCKLISLDYSQIELRLLAYVANIESLQEAFKRGYDIHAMTASEVFNVPFDQVDASLRRQAKAINFGIIYGISGYGLSRQLKIPQKQAAEYIKIYHQRYPGIKQYMEHTKEAARNQGYVETLFKRRCYISGINDRNPARRSFAERQAINAPLQGSAADIIKRAMIKMPYVFEESGLSSKMLLQVHDELIFESPFNEVEKAAQIIKNVMESSAVDNIPMVVDVKIGTNWAEAH